MISDKTHGQGLILPAIRRRRRRQKLFILRLEFFFHSK